MSLAHPKVKQHLKKLGNIKTVVFSPSPSLLNLPNNVLLGEILERVNNKTLTNLMRTSREMKKLGETQKRKRMKSRKPPGAVVGKNARALYNLLLLEQLRKVTRAPVHRRRRR